MDSKEVYLLMCEDLWFNFVSPVGVFSTKENAENYMKRREKFRRDERNKVRLFIIKTEIDPRFNEW